MSEENQDQTEDRGPEEYPGATSEGLAKAAEVQVPTIGQSVHYVLSEQDAAEINRRRTTGSKIKDLITNGLWPLGAQAHIGNRVDAGEVVPLIVTKDWGNGSINGQAILDGNDSLWVTSVSFGIEHGEWQWYWPPQA